MASLLATAALAGAAGATCPINTLVALDSTLTLTDASATFGQLHVCPDYGGNTVGGTTYNLTAGSASLTASGTSYCGGGAALSTHDVFTVVGPGAATPLSFTARLTVSASFSGHAGTASDDGNAMLREGAANSQSFTTGLGLPTAATLEVSITRAVGGTFDLFTDLDVSAFGLGAAADMTAQLSFLGLPAGYAVASCQGYASDPSVPVRATSWGRLKTLYR